MGPRRDWPVARLWPDRSPPPRNRLVRGNASRRRSEPHASGAGRGSSNVLDRFIHQSGCEVNDLDSCHAYQPSPARMPVIIRAPQDRDEVAWHELWAAYLDFYAATVSLEATRHTWRRIVAPAGPMFGRVALLGGTVVGFTICVVHDGSWSVNPTCYLEDFFSWISPHEATASGGAARCPRRARR